MSAEAPPPALRGLEWEVMETVWSLGDATVREVLEELERGGAKPRAYTTIMTTCARLATKGMLTRSRIGLRDLYHPVMSRPQYRDARAEAAVDELVEQTGEVALLHFARRLEALDPERRTRLERLAREG